MMARGRKLESLKDYQRALKNKYGIGQGTGYKPWLRIEDVKSHGIKSLIFGRKASRDHHMLSGIESEHFFLAEFSDSVTHPIRNIQKPLRKEIKQPKKKVSLLTRYFFNHGSSVYAHIPLG
jgi:hypothetical protein